MDLHLQSERDVRDILEEVAAKVSEDPEKFDGTDEQKIAQLYHSFMDDNRVNGLGNAP